MNTNDWVFDGELILKDLSAGDSASFQISTGYSAYDVIKAIRERAGLGEFGEDPYLDECAQSKEKMRELIRNERRIELCFEGFRFWDSCSPITRGAKRKFEKAWIFSCRHELG